MEAGSIPDGSIPTRPVPWRNKETQPPQERPPSGVQVQLLPEPLRLVRARADSLSAGTYHPRARLEGAAQAATRRARRSPSACAASKPVQAHAIPVPWWNPADTPCSERGAPWAWECKSPRDYFDSVRALRARLVQQKNALPTPGRRGCNSLTGLFTLSRLWRNLVNAPG